MHAKTMRSVVGAVAAALGVFACATPSAYADGGYGWRTNTYFSAAVSAESKGVYVNGGWVEEPSISDSAFAIDSTQAVFHVTEDLTTATHQNVQVDSVINFSDYYYLDDITNDVTSAIAALSLVTNEETAAMSWMGLTGGNKWVNLTGATTALGTYTARITADYSANTVSYAVKAAGADNFVTLTATESLSLAASSPTVSNVCFAGKAALTSINAVQSTTALCEVNGTEYNSLTEALAAANSTGKAILLFQNASVATADLKSYANTTFNFLGGKTVTVTDSTWTSGDGTYVTASFANNQLTVSGEQNLIAAIGSGESTDPAYATLPEAVTAAAANAIVYLLDGTTLTAPLAINKSITLNLNEYTLTYNAASGWALRYGDDAAGTAVISNGTIVSSYYGVRVNQFNMTLDNVNVTSSLRALQGTADSAIVLNGSTLSTDQATTDTCALLVVGGSLAMVDSSVSSYVQTVCISGADVTVDKDSSITTAGNRTALFVGANGSTKADVTIDGTVTCTGTTVVSTDSPFAICGNGTDHVGGDVEITANAVITAPNTETAIYWPQAGNLTITGGSITGGTAIWAKSGVVTITGGTITANGAKVSIAESNNGVTATGDAVVLEKLNVSSGYANNLSCTISGGTITSTAAGTVPVLSYAREGETALAGFITGGTFSSEPAASLIATGYKAQYDETEGVWTVVGKQIGAVIILAGGATTNEYETLAEALANLSAGCTVELRKAAEISDDTTIGVACTLQLNGFTLTLGNWEVTLNDNVTIVNSKATGGLLNRAQISIAADKTLDCGTLIWCGENEGGLIGTDDPATTTASFTLAAGSTLKLGNGPLPTGYKAGFITAAKGAKFYSGATVCYYNGTSWGDTPWAGSGTEADPYQIATEADLESLKAWVDAAKATAGKYFKQMNDIAMTKVWYGIGDNTDGLTPYGYTKWTTIGATFAGTYDGNNKTISNIVFSRTEYQGFFNTLSNATIKALTMDAVGFTKEGEAGCRGGAILVGCAYNSTFDHVTTTGTLTNGTHNTCGIAVKAHASRFLDCVNNAEIASDAKRVAGIIGFDSSLKWGNVFTNCVNNGDITLRTLSDSADYGVGGIMAGCSGSSSAGGDNTIIFYNCHSRGKVTITNGGTRQGSFFGAFNLGTPKVTVIAENCSADDEFIGSIGKIMPTATQPEIHGLYFATVTEGVAYFGDPASGSKVMVTNAPWAISAAGTFTLDETLAQANVTAANGYQLTSATGRGTAAATFTVVKCEAKAGGVFYLTLKEAFEKVPADGTVELCANVSITDRLVVTNAFTLNMAGYSITRTTDNSKYGEAIMIRSNGNLTVTGNGTFYGPATADYAAAQAVDSLSVICVDGGTLNFQDGVINAYGVDDCGMYGVYVLNGGTATFGTADGETQPVITAWFAAIGSNHDTDPATITVNDGTYTQQANGTDKWWSYFCGAIYAASAGNYTINGGTFTGALYSFSTRYTDVDQTVAFNAGTYNQPLFYGEVAATAAVGTRTITKGNEVTIALSTSNPNLRWNGNVVAKYFPGGTGTEADPYQIAEEDDLIALKDWVAAGKVTSGKFWKQTADIPMTAAFAGIGVRASTAVNGCFSGTYDGNNKSITNFKMDGSLKYQGLFNSTCSATIKSLTINMAGFKDGLTGEFGGAAFIGTAYGAILTNCVATGYLGTTAYPTTHNTAGLVCSAQCKDIGCEFYDCSCSASLVGNGTKIAGFVAITGGQKNGLSVLFKNCTFSGSVVRSTDVAVGEDTTQGGLSGFVGYATNEKVVFDACSMTGSVTRDDVDTAENIHGLGSYIGWMQNTGYGTDYATNSCTAIASIKSIGQFSTTANAKNIEGLDFATVSDGVATFCKPAADGTYKVMSDKAAFELAANESITLDETLATADVTTKVAGYEVAHNENTYSLSAIVYPITYDLAGGTVATANPATYTIESETFTLNNPTKENYDFAGWTGTNLTAATKTVTIEKGTYGVLGYTATWTEKAKYTVTFSTNGVANVVSDFTLDNVYSNSVLAAAQVPAAGPFTGGSWDLNPTGAVIVCNTNFNYTLNTVTPIAPGEQKELDVDPSDQDAEAKAQAEAAKIPVNITDAAAKSAGQADVVHTVAVYDSTSGKYVAEVQINTNATKYVAPEEAMPSIAAKLTEAAAASGTTSVTVDASDLTPGLYYTVYGADNVNLTDAVNGGSTLATGSSITLTMPKVTGDKAFFKVAESMTSVPANDE